MSKEKAPAFQMYPADLLVDANVIPMTMEEFGCYMRLLMICWREISLPSDINDLTDLCKGTVPSPRVLKCFTSTGVELRHKRLDVEREKQAKRRADCAKGGERSAHKRKETKEDTQQQCSSSAVQLKGNSSSSSSSSSSNKKKKRGALSYFCPDDFVLYETDFEWAKSKRPDLDMEAIQRETERFRLHEFGSAKSDWLKTWKNWILGASNHRVAFQGKPSKQPDLVGLSTVTGGLSPEAEEKLKKMEDPFEGIA